MTVEVAAFEFLAGAGRASYFWQLEVEERPGGGTLPSMGTPLATFASRSGRRTAATLALLLPSSSVATPRRARPPNRSRAYSC